MMYIVMAGTKAFELNGFFCLLAVMGEKNNEGVETSTRKSQASSRLFQSYDQQTSHKTI